MPKKYTVVVPDDLDEQIEMIARAKGKAKKEIVLEALQAYVEGSIVDRETLEATNAKCIWDAIKVLKAIQEIQLQMEEKRLMMEYNIKRRAIMEELKNAAWFARTLKKAARRLAELEREEGEGKGEKKGGLGVDDLALAFLAGFADRLGLLEKLGLAENLEAQQTQAGQGTGRVVEAGVEEAAEEEGEGEAEVEK